VCERCGHADGVGALECNDAVLPECLDTQVEADGTRRVAAGGHNCRLPADVFDHGDGFDLGNLGVQRAQSFSDCRARVGVCQPADLRDTTLCCTARDARNFVAERLSPEAKRHPSRAYAGDGDG
jgi:hypothetical protein